MTEEELQKRVEALKLDHIAAGSFISHDEAEEIIRKAYGLEADEKITSSSSTR